MGQFSEKIIWGGKSGDTDPKTLEFECRNGRKDYYVQKRELFSEEWPKYQKYFFVDFKQTLGNTTNQVM